MSSNRPEDEDDLIIIHDEYIPVEKEVVQKSELEQIEDLLAAARRAIDAARKVADKGGHSFSFSLNGNNYDGGTYYGGHGEEGYWHWNNSSLNC